MGTRAHGLDSPSRLKHKLLDKIQEFYARSPLRNLLRVRHEPEPAPQTIDPPVDGPKVDAETERFAASPAKLPARLLIVRATKEPWPDWVTVAPDQGWGGRADAILVRDVPANHLGVLRDPHVRTLAQAVADVSQA